MGSCKRAADSASSGEFFLQLPDCRRGACRNAVAGSIDRGDGQRAMQAGNQRVRSQTDR